MPDWIPISGQERKDWLYESVRGGKRWRVLGLTSFGWHLWPVNGCVGTKGGVKSLFRSGIELDDDRKWVRYG
jgi:hypothetical protein